MPVHLSTIRELLTVLAESNRHYSGSIPLYLKGLKRQARQEQPEAQHLLGLHYKIGFAVKTSRRKEKYWLTEAANAGYKKAQQFLEGNIAEAIHACFSDYEHYDDLSESSIMCGLGICYERGIGIAREPDLEKAFHLFHSVTENQLNHPHAHYKAAQAYEYGRGVDKNVAQAMIMYKKAAELGHAQACLRLAQVLEVGDGQAANPKQAFSYLQTGSRLGDAMCQHELGLCYLTGRLGVEIDEEKAVSLLKKSTANGWAYAAYDLGKCYFHGKGTLKNPRKAKKLIEKAYEKYPDSEHIGGFWNENGLWKY